MTKSETPSRNFKRSPLRRQNDGEILLQEKYSDNSGDSRNALVGSNFCDRKDKSICDVSKSGMFSDFSSQRNTEPFVHSHPVGNSVTMVVCEKNFSRLWDTKFCLN